MKRALVFRKRALVFRKRAMRDALFLIVTITLFGFLLKVFSLLIERASA
jgi:hypothetical protein